jgi:hypothetical protein
MHCLKLASSGSLEPCARAKPPPRFEVSDVAGWRAHLEREGYVVIGPVADAADCADAERLFWEWASEASPGLSGDDPSTWDRMPCTSANGIIGSGGIGQSAFMWRLRALPAVVRAFAALWDCGEGELITSFDGANVFRPFRAPAGMPAWRTRGGWFHVDQGVEKHGLHAVQGLVSLTAATSASGGLVVLPGTHLAHAELTRRYMHVKGDYVQLPHGDPLLIAAAADGSSTLVQCEQGDLVLWDSRVVHCNAPAVERGSEQNAPSLLRLAGYVCMTARARADGPTLVARRAAVDKLATSTHWPHDFDARYCVRSQLVGPSRYETLSPAQAALV